MPLKWRPGPAPQAAAFPLNAIQPVMTTTLAELLKDSAYRLSQFKPAQIQALEAAITLKTSGEKTVPYVTCLVRGKPIRLTPEEAIRQLCVMVLRDDLGYPVGRMELEYDDTFGAK